MKRWLWRACAVAVGLLGLNCTDSTGPRSFAGRLAFAPAFASSTAGIVDFDRARITVVQAAPPNAEVLDTIVAIPPTADSIDLSLSIPMSSSKEDMLLYLRLVNAAGDTVFQNSPYPQQVTVTTGGVPTIVAAPIVYVGVGYDAVAVTIATPDTSVLFGDTLRLTATAWNAQGKPIPGTPVAWRSLDSLRVKVPDAAVAIVVGGTQRGPAKIIAELLTGQADTIVVTAVPLPAQPKLQLSLQSSTPNVGQKYLLFVQPLDSLGTSRAVSTPLTITLVSSDPAHTTFDSATITIPTNGNIVQTGVTFTQAGSYTITGSATGYASDNVSATASGALVQMSGTNFVPQTVTINAGQYVTWRNLDPVSHTTTEDSGPIWNSGLIATGNTYQRLFGTAGTFTYHCTVHPGMTGTVIVQP